MASQDRTQEVFKFCMQEMFLRVGEKYPNEDLTSYPNWYTMRSWTINEEKEFRDGMILYLRKKLRWTKKVAEKEVSWFMLQWGWTTCQPLEMQGIKN
jgi:hypothetical protein